MTDLYPPPWASLRCGRRFNNRMAELKLRGFQAAKHAGRTKHARLLRGETPLNRLLFESMNAHS